MSLIYSHTHTLSPFPHTTNLQQQMTLKTSRRNIWNSSINPFPHIDAFWRLCRRRLFENIVTKEEIAQNEQFLLLQQCFQPLVIGYPFNYRDFLCFDKICSKSSAAELLYEGKFFEACYVVWPWDWTPTPKAYALNVQN